MPLGRWKASSLLGAAFAIGMIAAPLTTNAQRYFFEGFDELTLGPNVEEALAGTAVWTKTPPAGWTLDDSKMPGFGNSSSNGVTEWAGWSFANKNWWVSTAGDQRRSEFSFGSGNVMIADPDEWDDATHTQGLWDATATVVPIGITNAPANSLVLAYDSSWRPEATDDGEPNFPVDADGNRINDQTGYITAAFDGATATEVQRWDSIGDSPNYHDHMPNESVIVPLNNPAGAKNLVLKIGMEKAANDWWWAVDNLAVGVPPFAGGIAADGVSFTVRIVEALGKSVDQSKGVTATLDGKAVTPVTLTKDGNYLMVKYSQAPEIFVPGSKHSVKLSYTSNEGKALEDTVEFVAPSYTALAVTPNSVKATITEPEWLKVDESKGIQLKVDDAAVTGTTPVRADTQVSVSYLPATAFAGSSQHSLSVTFTTVAGKQVTDVVSFTIPEIVSIPTSLATDPGTASGAGMRWKTYQTAESRGNTIAEAENQLAGKAGADIHDTTGQGADGYFAIDYVNFDQAAGEAGNFKVSADAPLNVEDKNIPGIPGTGGGDDNISAQALTFLDLQPGVYTMAVNSDDGFQVSAGTTNSPTQVILGKYDGGRGTADSEFYFKIDKAGVYFFRLLYFEGGSGASVEWFTVNKDGSRALVGGSQTGAVKAYRTRTVAEPTGGSTGGGTLASQRYFFEGFDELTLGPNVEEALAGTAVWTKTPPAGWTLDDSNEWALHGGQQCHVALQCGTVRICVVLHRAVIHPCFQTGRSNIVRSPRPSSRWEYAVSHPSSAAQCATDAFVVGMAVPRTSCPEHSGRDRPQRSTSSIAFSDLALRRFAGLPGVPPKRTRQLAPELSSDNDSSGAPGYCAGQV